MKITNKALELTKRFAAGALCRVDFKNIEKTMFWPHYEALAREMKLDRITEKVVKKYWFEIHNKIVYILFQKGNYTEKKAKNCMVRPNKKREKLFCFHGGISVCPITKKEAELIRERTPKL